MTGMNDIIQITPFAWSKIHQKLDLTEGLATNVRIDIKTTGCSGYSYTFEMDNIEPTENEKFLEENGHKVIITEEAEPIVTGSVLDYIIQDIMTQGFDFVNPQEISRCGCNKSFSI